MDVPTKAEYKEALETAVSIIQRSQASNREVIWAHQCAKHFFSTGIINKESPEQLPLFGEEK